MAFMVFGITCIRIIILICVCIKSIVRAFTIGCPLGCRGSACVELMTTLHGSAPSLRGRVGGCVPLEGTIALARDPFKRLPTLIFLEPPLTF